METAIWQNTAEKERERDLNLEQLLLVIVGLPRTSYAMVAVIRRPLSVPW